MRMRRRTIACVSLLVTFAACGGDDDGEADGRPANGVVFPADYETSYTEVRDCRQGTQHGPDIRVFASSSARGPYEDRADPFPEGAVLVKEERFGNTDCTGPITQWTAMIRLADGSSPVTLDWTWQQVDPDRSVVGEDLPRCYECHVDCPDGYAGTCAPP